MKILITGHARSATGYFSKLMQGAGLDVGHEVVGRNGTSSWLHAFPGGSVSWLGDIEPVEFDHVVHVVRHPLNVIASAQTLRRETWEYMARALEIELPEDPIDRAMLTWIKWNELIEKKLRPALTIRAEDARSRWADLMKLIGCTSSFPSVPVGVNSRPHPMLLWTDLEKKNTDLVAAVKEKAVALGYETFDRETTLSVCMIVKNEERNLGKCLKSVVEVADEIIVVDTGSVDETVALAESFGAKVYHSPWRDDFSYHRNESLEYASSDWILRIDADEELIIDGDARILKAQLARIPEACSMTRNLMEDMQGGKVNLSFQQNHFFRRGKVHYENRKHNRPIFDGPIWQLNGIKTRHHGYDGSDQVKGKKERDLSLLKLMETEDPDDYHVLFWLGQTYGHYLGDAEKSLEYMEKYIEAAKCKEDFNPAAYMSAAEIARVAGRHERSEALIEAGLKKYPLDIDLNFVKVRNAAIKNDGATVECFSQKYLEAYDRMNLEPQKTDGRFTWFFNNDALCFVLHKAAVAHLFKGAAYLAKFEEYLPAASKLAFDSLRDCMDQDLSKIGVSLT
jgi:glycosyltransferase involved in cell wall biosynthesis